MNKAALFEQIRTKSSYLCVGLDPDLTKMPRHLLKEKDPILAFNKAIIDATVDHCVAYKPNIAFYEALGPQGWETLEKTRAYIPDTHFSIADAKRGDIGNTSRMYAKTFFEYLDFDAVTVAPYMGSDSVEPFLEFQGKWTILLGLTSNMGARDFQMSYLKDEPVRLFETVLRKAVEWADDEKMMLVIGATKAEYLQDVRKIARDYFLLIPGVGAQGGSLEEVSKFGMNSQCGLLVNSAREIIYASDGADFARAAGKKAMERAEAMKRCLDLYM
jgi:orotidine-5'-phosphate decarboxylase